jgi:hypothetical protein
MATTLKFNGLCGVGNIGGVYQAAMPAAHDHRAVVAVRVKQIDPTSNTSKPDFIFHDHLNTQWAGWNLGTKKLAFENGSGQPNFPSGERALLIDLDKFHSGAALKLTPGAVVTLPFGNLKAGVDEEKYEIFQGGQSKGVRLVKQSILWTGDYDVLLDSTSQLKITLQPGAIVNVSNVAPSMHGDHHFELYYELFQVKPPAHELVTIDNQNQEVYDCVPPVALP